MEHLKNLFNMVFALVGADARNAVKISVKVAVNINVDCPNCENTGETPDAAAYHPRPCRLAGRERAALAKLSGR